MDQRTRTRLIDTLVLGFVIWLIGYVASIILYGFVPHDILGWVLFIVFLPLLLYVPYVRFRERSETSLYYLMVALVWVAVAVVFDYIFIVKLFDSPDYYKPDVLVYYAVTFLAPFLVGLKYGMRGR